MWINSPVVTQRLDIFASRSMQHHATLYNRYVPVVNLFYELKKKKKK